MPEPPDKNLGEHRFRGAFILRPASPPPRLTRRQRVAAFFKRTRVLVAATIAALLTVAGLLNASLDLWGRTGGAAPGRTGFVQGDLQTGAPSLDDRTMWRDGATGCTHPISGEALPLLQEPSEDDRVPDEGEIGANQDVGASFSASSLVHPEVIDVDPNGLTRDVFLEQGAYVTGDQVISVVLANRSDEQLVVTGMSLDVERHAAPSGTLYYIPGGDLIVPEIIVFDLNEESPVARVVGDDCLPAAPFFAQYAFAIDAGSTELFHVELLAADCLCLVRLDIEYWHRGRWQTLTLPDAESARIPVTHNGSQRYEMLYFDNTSGGGRIEKYDCRQQDHELCEPVR